MRLESDVKSWKTARLVLAGPLVQMIDIGYWDWAARKIALEQRCLGRSSYLVSVVSRQSYTDAFIIP